MNCALCHYIALHLQPKFRAPCLMIRTYTMIHTYISTSTGVEVFMGKSHSKIDNSPPPTHLQVDLASRDGGQQLVVSGDARLVGDFRLLEFALIITGDVAKWEIRLVRHDCGLNKRSEREKCVRKYQITEGMS